MIKEITVMINPKELIDKGIKLNTKIRDPMLYCYINFQPETCIPDKEI